VIHIKTLFLVCIYVFICSSVNDVPRESSKYAIFSQFFSNQIHIRTVGMGQVVENLSSKSEAQGSIPSTITKKKKRKDFRMFIPAC
jgi:hypothetical protein